VIVAAELRAVVGGTTAAHCVDGGTFRPARSVAHVLFGIDADHAEAAMVEKEWARRSARACGGDAMPAIQFMNFSVACPAHTQEPPQEALLSSDPREPCFDVFLVDWDRKVRRIGVLLHRRVSLVGRRIFTLPQQFAQCDLFGQLRETTWFAEIET
jgi:hypothetical protein